MNYFQNTVIFFYLANELLSIIENVGRMGVPIPSPCVMWYRYSRSNPKKGKDNRPKGGEKG